MNEKLLELIKKGESERVEFKSSLSEWKEAVQTLSAFAWTTGGKILFGVSKSGKILNTDIDKGTLENLANNIKINTDPRLHPRISVEKIEGKNVILVEIGKVSDEPVLAFGRTYKRIGKSTHTASREEYNRIILEKKKVYFDFQVCEKATLEDIDWDFIKSFFIPKYEAITETKVVGKPKELLEALDCIKNGKPTNAGILLFGKTPQKFFMNAYIALARYKGKEIGIERLDYKEFKGNLFQQVDNCDKYIKERIVVMSRLLPYQVARQDIPEYGLFSIRELITNAVVHRDYYEQRTKIIIKMFDDRIEFYNPGGLPKEITPQNIMKKQFSKNPTIANVFAKVKYIEELGEGWDKILKEHREHALKPKRPRIEADEYTMLVTLFSTKEKFEKRLEEKELPELNARQRRAIEHIKKRGRISRKEYCILNEVSVRTAYLDLLDMVKKGVLKAVGKGRSIVYVFR